MKIVQAVSPKEKYQDRFTEELTDEEVVRRVRAGETFLFEMIMRRYNQRLFRVAVYEHDVAGSDSLGGRAPDGRLAGDVDEGRLLHPPDATCPRGWNRARAEQRRCSRRGRIRRSRSRLR